MTIDEAINWYETKLIVNKTVGLTGNQHEAAKLALAALREQRERMNNPVLTLEQLREMDGEPVWVRNHSAGTYTCRVIGLSNEYFIHFTDGGLLESRSYGLYWTAYRHKPEEGTA